MASGDIILRWVSESSAAIRDMNRVNSALGQSATKADRWGRRVNAAGNVAMAGLALAVPVAWQMVNAASDQEQAIGALNSVFKDYSQVMRTAADDANDLGLSTTEYATFATQLGAQLQNLGYDVEESAGLTQDLVDTAADMAAQFGGTTAEAVAALGSALRGENDPIERYAVNLSATKVQAYAAANGLSEAEAKVALLNEQLKKTGTIGAANREYKSFAAQVGRLQAAWADFMAEIGSGGTEDSASLIEELTKALKGVTRWVKNNPDTFRLITKGVLALAAALVTLKTALAVIGPLKTFLRLLSSPFALAVGWVAFEEWIDRMSDRQGGVYRLLSWVKDIADFLSNPVGNSFEIAIGRIVAVASKLPRWVVNLVPGVGGPGLLPGAPSLSVGRITTATPAPAVSVYVAGQRARSRTVVEPQWAPSAALGMI